MVDYRIRTKKGPQLTQRAPLFPGVGSVLVVSGEPKPPTLIPEAWGSSFLKTFPVVMRSQGTPTSQLESDCPLPPPATHRGEGGSGGLRTLTLGHCHPPGSHSSSSLDTYISLW